CAHECLHPGQAGPPGQAPEGRLRPVSTTRLCAARKVVDTSIRRHDVLMSKPDFPAEEFADRLARAREAIGTAGLDWLLVMHPMSLHWLIGTEAKSFQAFQCLALSARAAPLVMFTRSSERCEFIEDSLADEVVGWSGGEP